jgi:heme-degrading monooxygenase HmoA
MWARVSTYQLPSDDVEGGLQSFNRALGDLKEPGLERAELLVDRTAARALTITVWDSEDSLRTSVAAADRLRNSAADAAGVTILDVSHYEIVERGTPEDD